MNRFLILFLMLFSFFGAPPTSATTVGDLPFVGTPPTPDTEPWDYPQFGWPMTAVDCVYFGITTKNVADAPGWTDGWFSSEPFQRPTLSSFIIPPNAGVGDYSFVNSPFSGGSCAPFTTRAGLFHWDGSGWTNITPPRVSHFLAFPLPNRTPYTAQIAAVMDHSVNSAENNRGYYHINGTITAYDGETATGFDGDGKSPCYLRKRNGNCSILGYKQDINGTPFFLPLLRNYQDLDSSDIPNSPKNVLWYEGHPGYDYGAPKGENIKAAHAGILCIASRRTIPDLELWRDPGHCPYGRDVIADGDPRFNPHNPAYQNRDSWDRWHSFYIMFPGTNYSTWYLHAGSLNNVVRNTILSQGWTEVTQGTVVAHVGNKAPPAPVNLVPHLHFEVRTNGDTPIDPYGDGKPGNPLLLWKELP